MKKIILYLLLPVILILVVFFVVENYQFNQYISSHKRAEANTMNIPINQNAPVRSHAEIVVDAPVGKVWSILTEINDWPSWQSEVTESDLKGELKKGTEFTWKAGGLSFASRIHTIAPLAGFGWTGKTFGASAIHNWFFKEESGKTVIRVEESLQGVFPKLFKGYFQTNLDHGVQKNLEDLKAASEKKH